MNRFTLGILSLVLFFNALSAMEANIPQQAPAYKERESWHWQAKTQEEDNPEQMQKEFNRALDEHSYDSALELLKRVLHHPLWKMTTPLHLAIKLQNLPFAQFLIARTYVTKGFAFPDVNNYFVNDKSLENLIQENGILDPFNYAVNSGADDIAYLLMDFVPFDGPVLQKFIELKKLKLAEKMLRKAGPNALKDSKLLHYAPTAAAVNLLLKFGVDKDALLNGNVPLNTMIKQCSSGAFQALLQARPKLNDLPIPPLLMAVSENQIAYVKLLLEAGASPYAINAAGFCAFEIAFNRSLNDIMELLKQRGVFLDPQPALLYRAIDENKIDLVTRLIAESVTLNEPHEEYGYPIHRVRSAAMVELLIKHGANPKKIWRNNTVLQAVLKKHNGLQFDVCPVIKALIQACPELIIMKTKNLPPLHKARGRSDVFALLLNAGADVNEVATSGLTLLEQGGSRFVAKKLLSHKDIIYSEDISSKITKIKDNAGLVSLYDFKNNWRKFVTLNGWISLNDDGETPLLLACICQSQAAIQEFIDNQLARVPVRYSKVRTIEKDHTHETQTFKPWARYYINKKDNNFFTALTSLARWSTKDADIDFFLPYHEYEFNHIKKMSKTPLMDAAYNAAQCGNNRAATKLIMACFNIKLPKEGHYE